MLEFFNLDFSSMWTKNLQMYKLDLEEAEEPEIKLPTFIRSRESKRIPEKPTSASLTKIFDWVDHKKLQNS